MQDDDSIVNQVRGIQFFETGLVTGTEGDDLINLNRAEPNENGLTVSPGGGDNEIRLSNDDTDVDLILDENADNVIVARQNSEGDVDVDSFNNGDQIDLSRKGVEDIDELVFTQDNGTLTVELGDEDDGLSITVQDVDVLSEDDFIFAEADDEEEEVAEDDAGEEEEEVAEDDADDEDEEEVAEDDEEEADNSAALATSEGVEVVREGLVFGTDGDDVINLNELDAGNDVEIPAGTGGDTLVTSTDPDSFTLARLGDAAGQEEDDTVVVNNTGGEVQLFGFNAGDDSGDVIDLRGTGVTSFDQVDIRPVTETSNETTVEIEGVQDITLREGGNGDGFQFEEFNEDDFIFDVA